MTELKTLKDFDIKGEPEEIEKVIKILNVVKAEAIKWVKDCECKKTHWGSKKCESCWRFINFFNITEEDLK